MTWWEAVVLGVVQGLTEFFPVSSSGHLVLADELLGLQTEGITFDISVHVATLVSVLAVYRQRVFRLCLGCVGRGGDQDAWPYVLKIALATIPAGVVGVLFKDWFEGRFDDPTFAATMLLVTGTFVWSTRWTRTPERPGPVEFAPIVVAAGVSAWMGTIMPFAVVLALEAVIMGSARLTSAKEQQSGPGWLGAVFMGVAQAVAILPGISRSGSTVVTGLWRRIDPVAAAEFSFLMSVPAILGAAILQIPDAASEGAAIGAVPILAGFIAAAASGVLAIRLFVSMLRRQNFHAFGWYCWAAGALFLLFAA